MVVYNRSRLIRHKVRDGDWESAPVQAVHPVCSVRYPRKQGTTLCSYVVPKFFPVPLLSQIAGIFFSLLMAAEVAPRGKEVPKNAAVFSIIPNLYVLL